MDSTAFLTYCSCNVSASFHFAEKSGKTLQKALLSTLCDVVFFPVLSQNFDKTRGFSAFSFSRRNVILVDRRNICCKMQHCPEKKILFTRTGAYKMKTKLKTRSQSRPRNSLFIWKSTAATVWSTVSLPAASCGRESGSPPMESCWRTCTPKNARAFPTFPAVWNRRSALPMT